MIEQLRKAPNQLTAVRLVSVPIMWILAFWGARFYIGIGLTVGFFTDLFDGIAARRLNQASEFGSKFDSLADQCLQISAIFWIYMLMPKIIQENELIVLLALSTYFASLAAGLIKFKRLANLHLYLSKAGGLFLYIFIIHAFIVGQYNQVLLYLAGLSFIFSSSETLIIQLTSSEVGSDSGSILLRLVPDDHIIRVWLSRLP